MTNSAPRVITASTGRLVETVEGLLRRSLTDTERLNFTARLGDINTTTVAPGDLITADLFNDLRADLDNLSLRLAKLEGGKTKSPNEQIVADLSSKREALVKDGLTAIVKLNPSIVQPGGPAYGAAKMAKCLRDLELYFNAFVDALSDDDLTSLGEVMSQINEVNSQLGFSNQWIIEFYRSIKKGHGLAENSASIANSYLDWAIHALA